MTATFRTESGGTIPAVTAAEMREVDRIAVEEVGLELLQMMEHAGRNLAREAMDVLEAGAIAVVAGGGGNGGGGLCCARHLANRGHEVSVVLDRAPDELEGAARKQCRLLEETSVTTTDDASALGSAGLVIDALIGYGLTAAPHGRARGLIEATADAPAVLSLDVPSGIDATTGERPGVSVSPDRTLTLALPKTGLAEVRSDLVLGDIGIPRGVYRRAGLPYEAPFERGFRVGIESSAD